MSDHFMEALSGELNKEARTVTGTLVRRIKRRSRRASNLAKRGAGLKGILGKHAAESTVGDLVKAIVADAKKPTDAFTDNEAEIGVDDPRFGGGKGLKNLGGRRAPSFTDKVNPTDTPNAFGTGAGEALKTAMMDMGGNDMTGGEQGGMSGSGGAYGTGDGKKKKPQYGTGGAPKVSKLVPPSMNPSYGHGGDHDLGKQAGNALAEAIRRLRR